LPAGLRHLDLEKPLRQAPITDMCIVFNEVLLEQARITAACNAVHDIEARFCRWLLQTRDRSESNTIMLTQEFLSEMPGVCSTSVTGVAHNIQAHGVISYSRGVIKILNLEAPRALSCECYETLRVHTAQRPACTQPSRQR
jgi:hypothetical protein